MTRPSVASASPPTARITGSSFGGVGRAGRPGGGLTFGFGHGTVAALPAVATLPAVVALLASAVSGAVRAFAAVVRDAAWWGAAPAGAGTAAAANAAAAARAATMRRRVVEEVSPRITAK
jgi:hypothetical protein